MQNSTPVQSTHATTLWINGVSHSVTMLWVTQSHAEIIVGEDVDLVSHQLTAVIVREFLSLPMRVVAQSGQNVVLHFVQKPHSSVMKLINGDLQRTGIAHLRDLLEENAVPDQSEDQSAEYQEIIVSSDKGNAPRFDWQVRELEVWHEGESENRVAA